MKIGTSTNRDQPMKLLKNGTYKGVAARVCFGECDGILVAPNLRSLKKLAGGYYLTRLDMTQVKRVVMEKA